MESKLDLFEAHATSSAQPLAYRMRPRTLDEYIGQEHIVGEGRLLRRAIKADQLSSVIFYGPPGTGKTTLARVIANTTKSHFSTLNAVLSGVSELRKEITDAKERLALYGKKTILFVDEVHRWNKSQQDALLPWVENGTFILIGATTENPFFEVNAALVSRSRIFQLKSLTDTDLEKIGHQALTDKERGYGNYAVSFEAGAFEHLVKVAKGDARSLLNALQLAVETSVEPFPPPVGTKIYISKDAAEQSIQQKAVLYDKEGDYHFDVISAFIKSLRGSDPDAALYWLAKMIDAGEDPRFIFRRMLISAAEDVGLADPRAIQVVEADAAAFDRIGMPEGRFHLGHAALYLATCLKSNTTLSLFDALATVREEKQADEVPNHLRDASRDSKGFGHGEGYLYPHAYKDHWVAQQYLPTSLQGKVFYTPGNLGYEAEVRDRVLSHREAQLEATQTDAFPENLTYSPGDKARQQWLSRTTSERGRLIELTKQLLYQNLHFTRSDRVLVLGAGHGLLLWEAFRKTPEGYVCAQVQTKEQLDHITHYASTLDKVLRPFVAMDSKEHFLATLDPALKFEKIIGRNIFNKFEETEQLLPLLKGKLAAGGVMAFAQTVPGEGSRLSDFVTDNSKLQALLKQAEQVIFKHDQSGLSGWNDQDLSAAFTEKGLYCTAKAIDQSELRHVLQSDIARWISGTYAEAWHCAGIEIDLEAVTKELVTYIADKNLKWNHHILILESATKKENLLKSQDKNKNTDEWQEVHKKTH
ncbi:MAG: AAA family ATPase [Spirochaetia bacterium]|jgi:putative ATPase|nr:AAA family ATPase [Spirochaetia bacterium]